MPKFKLAWGYFASRRAIVSVNAAMPSSHRRRTRFIAYPISIFMDYTFCLFFRFRRQVDDSVKTCTHIMHHISTWKPQ